MIELSGVCSLMKVSRRVKVGEKLLLPLRRGRVAGEAPEAATPIRRRRRRSSSSSGTQEALEDGHDEEHGDEDSGGHEAEGDGAHRTVQMTPSLLPRRPHDTPSLSHIRLRRHRPSLPHPHFSLRLFLASNYPKPLCHAYCLLERALSGPPREFQDLAFSVCCLSLSLSLLGSSVPRVLLS